VNITDLRGIADVNALSESQFDPYWMDIFNGWMRQILVEGRKKQ